MASTFTELAIDCADPEALARFWCAVLGYEVRAREEGTVTIGPPAVPEREGRPGPPILTFATVPEPKIVKNRMHIDLSPSDREQRDEIHRLIELGARRVDVGQGEQSWVVLADPEGNEFCVLAGRRP